MTAAGTAGLGGVAGCLGGDTGETAEASSDGSGDDPVVRSSFFVFGDLAARIAGDAATAELLVPVGQHGHGWEPGPRVREEIHEADLFVHGMPGFQPWVDDIVHDLAADGADVTTVDASAGIDLLAVGSGHGHGEADDHETEHGDGADPHFWMDPLRVKEAAENVRRGMADIDEEDADAYAANATALQDRLDTLHERIASAVDDGSNDTILVAGHNAYRYLTARYGVDFDALTDASPDDRPTAHDIERARELVDEHGLRYVCADPLESQRAAEQLVAETDAEAVLPLTAMPGLTDEWDANGWGYVEVMENVNLPTLDRVLEA